MAIATTTEVINRAAVSIYLSGNDNAKGSLFSPRKAAPGSPVSIALIRDTLNWANTGGAETAVDIRQMANYLEWLIGVYGQQAQYILTGSGGGSVVPGGGSSYAYINLVDTIVSQGSTYSNTYFVGATQINTLTVNSGPLQTINTDFTVDTVTGILTWSQTFFVGDIINLTFLRLI